MSNWIPKNKIIILAIVAVLLSITLYFSGLFFVSRKIKNIEDTYYSTESDSYKEGKVRAIKSITEINKELIQILQNFFVKKGDEVKFIEEIENIARASSIEFEITSIDVKENKTDSFKEDVNIKMRLTGSWREVESFINKLEKMSFGVSVENVNLNADIPGNWSGFIEFIIFREK